MAGCSCSTIRATTYAKSARRLACDLLGVPRLLGFFELRNDGPKPEGHPYHIRATTTWSSKRGAGPVKQAPVDPNVHNGRFVSPDEALVMNLPCGRVGQCSLNH